VTAIASVAVAAWWASERRRSAHPWMAAAIGAAAVARPLTGIAAAAVAIARIRWRRARSARTTAQAADADVTVLADLVVLSLTAGLSLRAAFAAVAGHVHPELRSDLDELGRRMDRDGMAAALSATTGRLAGLARVAAGAAVSGAPLGGALTAFAGARRHEAHMVRMEAARRLPVRLLLPLALLILPGFVLLAVGPAVLEGLARLGPIP